MASTPAWRAGAISTRRSAMPGVSMPATRMATASARCTSTPSRASGPCGAPGSARTAVSRKTSCRSISASSNSCTTHAVAAKPYLAPSSPPWSYDSDQHPASQQEPCQIGVFLAYASRHGHALIDRALYLPQTWTDDPSRCRNAGIPDAVTFTTKPKIGRAMLERALAAHLPFAWVTGDSVYGADSALRRAIEAASKGYVLTVTSAQRLGLRPVGDWATEVPKGGWTRLSA